MVHPLVGDHDRALDFAEVRHTVLCEDGESEARNHIRNAVVNFRVDVIGAACENNAVFLVGLAPLYRSLALGFDIPL